MKSFDRNEDNRPVTKFQANEGLFRIINERLRFYRRLCARKKFRIRRKKNSARSFTQIADTKLILKNGSFFPRKNHTLKNLQ